MGFPGGSDDRDSSYNAADLGLIPGSGRFHGEGTGYLLQYFCLGNSMDKELGGLQSRFSAWCHKESDRTE